jgi:hypothetical protein
MVMTRFNSDGSLDATYGDDGAMITPLGQSDFVHKCCTTTTARHSC